MITRKPRHAGIESIFSFSGAEQMRFTTAEKKYKQKVHKFDSALIITGRHLTSQHDHDQPNDND